MDLSEAIEYTKTTTDVEDDIIYQFLSEYMKTMGLFYEENSKPFEL